MNIALSDKIDILNILYDTVEEANSFAICTKDKLTYVVNIHGEEILSAPTNEIQHVGNFIIHNCINNEIIVLSLITGVQKSIATNFSSTLIFGLDIQYISEGYIAIYCGSQYIIFDSNVNIVAKIDDIYMAKAYKLQGDLVAIYYRMFMEQYKAIFNTRLGKMILLDSQEFLDGTELVAVEQCDCGYSLNKDIKDKFKYKLSKDGIVLTKKAYQDITKPSELHNTGYMYTHDYHNNTRCMGIINNNGEEIVQSIYSNISYIGAGYFILVSTDNSVDIYNTSIGILYENNILSAKKHDTLPIVLVQFKNNQFLILDTLGRWFKPEEISKYFDCMYSETQNNIIRINLDYGVKYITNTFIPITNIHEISKLATHKWIPM